MLPALSFRSVWGPTATCFVIAICAWILVGKECVLILFFLWWFSALAFLLEKALPGWSVTLVELEDDQQLSLKNPNPTPPIPTLSFAPEDTKMSLPPEENEGAM